MKKGTIVRRGGLRAASLRLALALAVLGSPARAFAEPLRPAILYNLVKFDASFNEGAYRGIERYKSETGTPFRNMR
jgi:basic membrane protein A and related proteins